MIDTKSLGKTLQDLREQRKLTQRVVAQRIGLTTTYISLIETANRLPRLDTLNKFAEAFGITVSHIITLA